jgi:hypothetical protein
MGNINPNFHSSNSDTNEAIERVDGAKRDSAPAEAGAL